MSLMEEIPGVKKRVGKDTFGKENCETHEDNTIASYKQHVHLSFRNLQAKVC